MGCWMVSRGQNYCEDCRYSWYPRGHSRSVRCPRCKSPRVVTQAEVDATRQARREERQELAARIKNFGYAVGVLCPACGQVIMAGQVLTHYDQLHMWSET